MPDPTNQPPATASPAKPDDTDGPARTKAPGVPGGSGAGGTLSAIGSYRILRELGRGGMGVVYHAHHDFLYGDVALKVMTPDGTKSDAEKLEAKERFLREARATFQVQHENVVRVYDANEFDGVPYIAMELLAGLPLDKRLKDGPPVALREALRIVRQTALGLTAVHARGLVHRDLKPGNLWIEAPSGRVKVLDFGIVKQAGDLALKAGDPALTKYGQTIGTPWYMSPEQARGQQLDARSDLFSLGTVLYQLCSGCLPFDGNSQREIEFAIYLDPPKPVRAVNPAVPVPVAELIHALLEKDPAKRVPTAAALAERIAAIEAALDRPAVVPPPPPPPGPSPRERLATGRVTIDELLALKAAGTAESDLWMYSAQIWPVVKAAALGRADVRDAFRLLIATPDNVRELWNEAVSALRAGNATAMSNWLNVVREAVGAERVFEFLTELYDTPVGRTLSPAARDILHAARELYARFANVPAQQPAEPDPLDDMLEPDPPLTPPPPPLSPPPPPPTPPRAQPVRSPLERLRNGDEVTINELLALKEDPLAAYDLGRRADAVWDVVRRNLHLPAVRAAFRDLLAAPDRILEVWREAVDALLAENYRVWDARWAVVRESAGKEWAKKKLAQLLGDKNEERLGKLPTDVRAKMRAACADVELLPSRALLVPLGLGELEPLLAAPPEQTAYTAFVILAPDSLGWLSHVPPPARDQMRARAKQYLCAAPLPAFAAYVREARPYLDSYSHFLDVLFKPHSAPAAALLSRVLAADVLEPGDWHKLINSVGLLQDEWGTFLLEKNHLSQLLVGLGGDGTGKDVWQAYLELLSSALVSPELVNASDDTDPALVTAWERTVHAQLKLAADKLGAAGHRLALALESGNVRRLVAANNLVKWVADPASAERDGIEELRHACEEFGMTPYDLARAAFLEGGYQNLDLPTQLPKLEPLVALFRTAFPADSPHGARSAVTYWLKLSQEVPKRGRAAFQAEFVLKCVPEVYYRDLLAEARQTPFEPVAVERINELLQGKVKRKPQKAKPAMPEPEFANEVTDGELPGDESVAKPIKKSLGNYKLAQRNRRAAGADKMLYLGAGCALVALLALALAGWAIFAK